MNCILINFIWPLLVYVIYKIRFYDVSLDELRNLASNCDNGLLLIILLFVVSVSILLPAVNSIAASSFSREGKNFDFMKSIPFDYDEQVFVKSLVSISIAFLGVNIFTVIFYIMIGLPLTVILIYVLISLLCIFFISELGVLIDSINPKLVWDDELNALRENTNNFIVMGITLLIFGIFIAAGYFINKAGVGIDVIFTVMFSVLFILNIIILMCNNKFTIKNIIEVE